MSREAAQLILLIPSICFPLFERMIVFWGGEQHQLCIMGGCLFLCLSLPTGRGTTHEEGNARSARCTKLVYFPRLKAIINSPKCVNMKDKPLQDILMLAFEIHPVTIKSQMCANFGLRSSACNSEAYKQQLTVQPTNPLLAFTFLGPVR